MPAADQTLPGILPVTGFSIRVAIIDAMALRVVSGLVRLCPRCVAAYPAVQVGDPAFDAGTQGGAGGWHPVPELLWAPSAGIGPVPGLACRLMAFSLRPVPGECSKIAFAGIAGAIAARLSMWCREGRANIKERPA